jgi:hypothetical protein
VSAGRKGAAGMGSSHPWIPTAGTTRIQREKKNSTRLELQRKELGKERKTAEGVKNPIEKKNQETKREGTLGSYQSK